MTLRPVLNVLGPTEIERIKEVSREILDRVGVVVGHDGAREALRAAGCGLDGERVYFPPRVVEEAIKKAPRQFTLHARNATRNVTVGGEDMVLVPGYGAPFVTGPDGVKRPATLADFVQLARLAGASENMSLSGGVLVEPADVGDDIRHKVMLYTCIANSDKPFMGSATGREHALDCLTMAARLFGGEQAIRERPVMITLINSLSPLMYDERMAGALVAHAAAGQPVIVASLAMAGTTAPATLAGTLALQDAEVLAGITLAQSVREGTPVVYGSVSSITEMRYGSLSIGAPEGAWIISAAAQLAHSYSLPCRAGGCLTDSKLPDAQAAYESMMNMQATALAGTDFVLHAAGILDSYMGMSLEKFVLDDEICSMVRRLTAATVVDEESLASGLIGGVGPGGQFLTSDHTFRHFRQEFWQPKVSERTNYDQWRQEGAPDTMYRLVLRKQELLEEYRVPALDKETDAMLRRMMED